jgi:hypothetical protein
MIKASVHFYLIITPCCGLGLCWVNPRLPNYCPECGRFIFATIRHIKPDCIRISSPNARIEYEE